MPGGFFELLAREVMRLQCPQYDIQHGHFPGRAADAIWSTREVGDWSCDYESESNAYQGLRCSLKDLWPDGFGIDTERRQVLCFEIEDTNKLTREKLYRYFVAFGECDYYRWTLRLFVADRYGQNVTELLIVDFQAAFVASTNENRT